MKKIYYVDCDSEYACKGYLTQNINELGYWGFYPNKRQGIVAIKKATKLALKEYAKEIEKEKDKGNTITIDLWETMVRDDFDTENDSIWGIDNRNLIASKVLCGGY